MTKSKQTFRDVSGILQTLRNFFLGRKYTLHGRFPPLVSPRSIPPPDIPRGMDLKYSGQYYFKRHAFDSVKPPVVAPVAAGGKGTGSKGSSSCEKAPTPGSPWWWDGHFIYECTPDEPKCTKPKDSSKST